MIPRLRAGAATSEPAHSGELGQLLHEPILEPGIGGLGGRLLLAQVMPIAAARSPTVIAAESRVNSPAAATRAGERACMPLADESLRRPIVGAPE